MHKRFDHTAIEKKWQENWKESGIYDAGARDQDKDKEYVLVELPYPSGNLHIGHWYAFAVPDIYVRYKRMLGKQVLYPMGFDAFGLPAENAAIKRNVNPREWTKSNIEYMRAQLDSMGVAFSWDKTTSTIDPEYYKWTQWMFGEFFKNNIAYRGEGVVNWCPGCHTVIANEQVLADGTCERSGDTIEKKRMPQWMMRITDFADSLLEDLDALNWPEHIKEAQRQWIGRSKGAEIGFKLNLPSLTGDVVFASTNKGKIARITKLIEAAGLSINLVSPVDVGVLDFDVIEDGQTILENSTKKALALSKLTSLPVLADDTGFFIENVEIDPVTVKRNALAGKNEKDLTVVEIAVLMQEYYKDIATKHGGSVPAQWRSALTLAKDGVLLQSQEAVRPVTLTNELHGEPDPSLPLRGLYISAATNKYALEGDEDEELAELAPITESLHKLFSTSVKVFTTRPDTLFGATYLVLAPEHAFVEKYKDQITNWDEVAAYVQTAKQKSEIERGDNTKEKTGVKLEGITANNPANGEEIPVYIADYVLGGYGTGAIMAVPAHDERDNAFAKIKGLKIKYVVLPSGADYPFYQKTKQIIDGVSVITEQTNNCIFDVLDGKVIYEGAGYLVDSGEFEGMDSEEAKVAITEKVGGRMTNTYRLRDWSIGRQRYWGVPIPIVYDPEGKAHAVPKEHLPWTLPEDVDFKPTGEPPLAKSQELKERTERIFGAGWTSEVETMDTFVDSSWYFLRYLDNHNDEELASKAAQRDWMQVDMYFGGAEHTTMHLLYSRFWQKALHKLGLAEHSEPYLRRANHGVILGPDGNKMSKSKGNVVDPDEQVRLVGADTVKMYLAFMGPYENSSYPWDPGGVAGLRRFLERVNGLALHITDSEPKETLSLLHKTIKKVGDDIAEFKFNTAISAMMIFVNQAEKEGLSKESYRQFLCTLAPFAAHLSEELWQEAGNSGSVHEQKWAVYNPELTKDATLTIGVQINGKHRGEVTIATNASQEEAYAAVQNTPELKARIANGTVEKMVYVPGRIINLIHRE